MEGLLASFDRICGFHGVEERRGRAFCVRMLGCLVDAGLCRDRTDRCARRDTVDTRDSCVVRGSSRARRCRRPLLSCRGLFASYYRMIGIPGQTPCLDVRRSDGLSESGWSRVARRHVICSFSTHHLLTVRPPHDPPHLPPPLPEKPKQPSQDSPGSVKYRTLFPLMASVSKLTVGLFFTVILTVFRCVFICGSTAEGLRRRV